MALLPYALCTVAEFKSYRFGDAAPSGYDTLIELLIDAATERIENYLGGRRIFNDGNFKTELYDGTNRNDTKKTLWLKSFPVAEIQSISYSLDDDLSNPTYEEFSAATDYSVNAATGEVCFLSVLPRNIQNIKVVYKAGYTDIPSDLKLACLQIVAQVFDKRKSQGIVNEDISQNSIEWEQAMSFDVRQILDFYKTFVFV